MPADLMPLEQAALLRELITAYRLLEDHAGLKVGGWVGGVGWRVGGNAWLRGRRFCGWSRASLMRASIRICCTCQHSQSPGPPPQPGDAVLLNAATSTVGQLVIQLCHLLRLRAIAVVSGAADFEKARERERRSGWGRIRGWFGLRVG